MYKSPKQGWVKHADFIILDLVCLYLSFMAAYLFRHGTIHTLFNKKLYVSLGVVLLVFDLLVIAMGNTFHGVIKRGMAKEFTETIKQDLLVFAGMTIYLFTLKDSDRVSRTVLWLTVILHVVVSYGTRLLWKRFITHRRLKDARRSMLLVADAAGAEAVLRRVQAAPAENISISGVVLTDGGAAEAVAGVPVVCALEDAPRYICREWIDEVYVVAAQPPRELIDRCKEMGVTVHRELQGLDGDRQFVEELAGKQVLTSTMKLATPGQMFLKRTMDIVGGLVGSLMALVIIAVFGPRIKKASAGPILFRQERIGQNGRRFTMLKLRSMYMDAEERKAELMKDNRVSDGRMFKLDFDPRIIGNEILPDGTRKTGIGEFLRNTSLDEFPQFFCVLRGTMSLVGTRPPTVDEWEKYEYHHRARLAIKPGLTGMWQVSGRSRVTDFEEVVNLDTQYINNWSLGLDMKILFKTIVSVLRRDGAM